MSKHKILAIIPARAGSTRIPGKNIKKFCGKPLIAYTILQAKKIPFVDRIVVDTDSEKIARIARHYGAEVPFLRPLHLATSTAQVLEAIKHLLNRLKNEEKYNPDYIMILQTTSPLREDRDIYECWNMMRRTNAGTVLTVAPTHPRLYHLDKNNNIVLANRASVDSTNVQAWPPAYLLNGCFVYIVNVKTMLRENIIITKNTKAVICDKWRSVDLDTPDDWILAELLYKNRKKLSRNLKKFK